MPTRRLLWLRTGSQASFAKGYRSGENAGLASGTIPERGGARVFGAMSAAEYRAVLLNTMADDFTATMSAYGSEGLDGALKGIECVQIAS